MTVRTIRPGLARGRLRAPPSKSYTHRALVAAYLADRRCEVVRPLESEDTRATRDGLRVLGAKIHRSRNGWIVTRGRSTSFPSRRTVHCGESGTTLRLLSAVAALGSNRVAFEGAPQLATRPMNDLFDALRTLGVEVHAPSRRRSLPCTIRGPLGPGSVTIRGNISSQFTSALLMVLPTAHGTSRLRIQGTAVSQPYVEATCAVLRDRSIRIRRSPDGFIIPGNQKYRAGRILVPGDASSAAYLWSAGAATGGTVTVEGVSLDLPQADLAILRILSKMGARVARSAGDIRVSGPLSRPIVVDLTDSPDLFPLVAALAALIPGRRSQLLGAPHLEFKESNRRTESIRLARALGAEVSENSSRVAIVGADTPRSLELPSLRDHRLVMSAAVAALVGPRVSRVGVAEAVSKSFPGFWVALNSLTEGVGAVR
jgi:3-phosphoshikimate 1-carboxyvinyltransferase